MLPPPRARRGRPPENERPHPHRGNPILHHVAGACSGHRDKAGRPRAVPPSPHPSCCEVTPTTDPLPLRCLILRRPSPGSRPFVLASLRALRLDPDSVRRVQPSTKERLQQAHPQLTGDPATDKERPRE